MNIAQIDALAARLQRVGQAGALPKNLSQAQLIDELQRELGILGDATRALLEELRAGPRYTKNANIFLMDARAGGNVLTVAQATAEGLGAVAGLAIYRHGLGYKLDRAVQVWAAGTPTVGVVDGQDKDNGSCWIYKYDDFRTVFQMDQDAQTNLSTFIFSCYSSLPVPAAKVNPGQAAKTGASTRQLGTITAALAPSGLP